MEKRISDLLMRMTLKKKPAQMLCIWGLNKEMILVENGYLFLSNILVHLKDCIEQIGRLSNTNESPTAVETAELAKTLLKIFIEKSKLGIPLIFHEEYLHCQHEAGSNSSQVNFFERILRDTFLYNSKQAIEKTNVYSVIAYYNAIDCVPPHANKWLFRDIF